LVGYLSYRSALGAAAVYGHQIRVAFDLYRDALRERLGDQPESNGDDERNYWERLGLFWYRGIPRDHAMTQAEAGGLPRLLRQVLTTWEHREGAQLPAEPVGKAPAQRAVVLPLSVWLHTVVVLSGIVGAVLLGSGLS
jgi:hypothetical protein